MIGRPEPTEKGVKVTSLLQPGLKPNDAVEVRSEYDDGTFTKDDSFLGGGIFRINTVEFMGSSYGDAFYSVLDCQRMAEGVVEQEPNTEQAEAARAREI